jgi:hypothetical protein
MIALQKLIAGHIAMRLRSLPKALTDEIYALSLFMDLQDIDEPQLVFSFNTNSQVTAALAGKTQAFGSPADLAEARWNYAFWLQKPNSRFLTPSNAEDGKLWQALCQENNLRYDESDDFDIDQYEDKIRDLLANLAVAIAKDLHESKAIVQIFGKSIPVIIHELEYYDELANITGRGNPPGVADEFIDWVKNAFAGETIGKTNSSEQFLQNYSGESVAELIELASRYRVDSIVLAFEEAISRKKNISDTERTILAVEALEREVNNGGYDQFFTNSSNEFAPIIVEALKRVGCARTAEITQKAIDALGISGGITREAVESAMEDEDQQRTERLSECDDLYYEGEEPIAERLFAFIKNKRNSIKLQD